MGGCHVIDDHTRELQDVDARERAVTVSPLVQEGGLPDFVGPLDVPPELQVEAVATCEVVRFRGIEEVIGGKTYPRRTGNCRSRRWRWGRGGLGEPKGRGGCARPAWTRALG